MTAATQLNIEGTSPIVRLGDGIAGLMALEAGTGDLVCDPMAGAGTTGSACIATGRRYLCWDSDARFATRSA
jgi:hypothetical protein